MRIFLAFLVIWVPISFWGGGGGWYNFSFRNYPHQLGVSLRDGCIGPELSRGDHDGLALQASLSSPSSRDGPVLALEATARISSATWKQCGSINHNELLFGSNTGGPQSECQLYLGPTVGEAPLFPMFWLTVAQLAGCGSVAECALSVFQN
eukprot:1499703-Amphidinium_carterae.1